jgi:leucyl aminopeptidase
MSLQIKLVNQVVPSDLLGVFVASEQLAEQIKQLPVQVVDLAETLADQDFKGQVSGSACIRLTGQSAKYLVLAGLGKAKNGVLSVESLRRATAKLVRASECRNAKSLTIVLPEATLFGITDAQLLEQVVTVAKIANHKFDTYLTDNSKKERQIELSLVVPVGAGDLSAGLAKAELVANATNQTRQWVDTPANHFTPAILADHAQKIARETGLKATVFGGDQIEQMGFGGIHAVARGSVQEGRMILLEYTCGDVSAPTIALVGKGITYDTGGLSIKPANSMETMKDDMAGAAAVISTMEVLAKLKPKVNVVGCAPAAENMPSGSAGRPGDIITFYNGKTAEVKNTDAEGRLILADGLSYVTKHYKLAAVVDIATLTGACEYALGTFFAGLVSEHDDLAGQVAAAGMQAGEPVWRLPLTDDYKSSMKSEIADLSNISSGRFKCGTITGAVFLQNFVGDVPWVHIDIANVAYDLGMLPYYRSDSATGFGVRLLVEFALNFK